MNRKGFTLIEMLIVIAVIGVLAIAVLSAINPVEQMRKARDTRRRSNAAELMNAVERYYATNERYPSGFSNDAVAGAGCAATGGQITGANMSDLIGSNELKPEFTDRVDQVNNELFGAIEGGSELVTVCYEIEAASNHERYSNASCYVSDSEIYACLPE
jgi:prepilin-type N-terminal cleavage/methylation domain-containing protein